jgi:hypothetical protein
MKKGRVFEKRALVDPEMTSGLELEPDAELNLPLAEEEAI